ncbi:hypothetical protein O181_007496 [Austropuccinia psidii MF-1]|uniref:Peptidase A2 domain-containing protein n=1 Tax=Austropuccinia psidii MF-1 TaxID=1389203 RepID=A0A9Q3BMX9_9BASI|nr:hypothetical protein [Austropuccinia psidii MF-1]
MPPQASTIVPILQGLMHHFRGIGVKMKGQRVDQHRLLEFPTRARNQRKSQKPLTLHSHVFTVVNLVIGSRHAHYDAGPSLESLEALLDSGATHSVLGSDKFV